MRQGSSDLLFYIFERTSVIWSDNAFEVRQVETGIKSGSNGSLKHIDHVYKVEHYVFTA